MKPRSTDIRRQCATHKEREPCKMLKSIPRMLERLPILLNEI